MNFRTLWLWMKRPAAMKRALMQQQRGGPAHCRMLDLCLLTGQRVSDVLKMRWQDVTDEGVLVDQGKTGAPLLIEWTPQLRAVVDAMRPTRSSASRSRCSTRKRLWPPAGRRPSWRRPACTAASRTKAGASARTAATSGPTW